METYLIIPAASALPLTLIRTTLLGDLGASPVGAEITGASAQAANLSQRKASVFTST
jgi:hypothetical protein